MYIKEITLKDFRNYEKETINFKDGLNVVIGNNAMGKTNLLESIYCCGIGKSVKTNKYKELIRWGSNTSYIKIVLQKKYRDYIIEFSIDDKEKKIIKINGVPLKKLSEIVGIMNVIYFSPDEMKLIKESPVERRRFMDISLAQQSKSYLYSLSRYNEIIDKRNKLLKDNYKDSNIKDMLTIWNDQLVKEGAFIISKRYEFVDKLKVFAEKVHSKLTDGKEKLELEYESVIKNASLEEMIQDLKKKLEDSVDKDLSLQYTNIGPHRDDISIKSNNIDMRKYGSQGQQRTCALSLKLAEISLFEDNMGETPILLLDDVLSELDESRRNMLMELSAELQTIITCTDFDMTLPHNEIRIVNGKLDKS